jgi:hypothetical protein
VRSSGIAPDDMQDHPVVPGVGVVPVKVPLCRGGVDLDVTAECRSADADDGLQEIRTAVRIGRAGMEDRDTQSVVCAEVRCRNAVRFPDPV